MHVLPLLLSFFFLPTLTSASEDDQIVMDSGLGQPDYVPLTTPQPTLADLLTIEPSASIFYSYARELELSSMFSDQSAQVSLFVPTNKAIMALSRKPHEGPKSTDDTEGVTEEQYDKAAKRNVEQWVSAHILLEYPVSFDVQDHQTLLHSKSIGFRPTSRHGADWTRVTLENDIRIIGKKEALNGDLYLIDGTISPA